jgi:hypothetical protein
MQPVLSLINLPVCALLVSHELIPKPSEDKNPWSSPPTKLHLHMSGLIFVLSVFFCGPKKDLNLFSNSAICQIGDLGNSVLSFVDWR